MIYFASVVTGFFFALGTFGFGNLCGLHNSLNFGFDVADASIFGAESPLFKASLFFVAS
jgi:hypothetical protein